VSDPRVIAPSHEALEAEIRATCTRARSAAHRLAELDTTAKDRALIACADTLAARRSIVLEANAEDLARARTAGHTAAFLDRLRLDDARLDDMFAMLHEVRALPDPVGLVTRGWRRPNGLLVEKVRIPLGVIAIVYEARPNVTIDAAALCLKSGNACVLRGGSEARASNTALVGVMQSALEASGLPTAAVQTPPTPGREAVSLLVKQVGLVDLVIPRGGEGLIRAVTEEARVPVIQHFKGVCHAFLDATADPEMTRRIVLNAKAQRPGVCNALECLLVHADAASTLLPPLAADLRAAGVELRGCERTRALLPGATPATEDDWGREFLDLVIAVRLVDSLDAAIAHIRRYGSEHTELIVTRDVRNARAFVQRVTASCVIVNASTRFNDGGQLGLGAEIGISTSRLHAFGPMGLEALTTEKFVVFGDGQVRA